MKDLPIEQDLPLRCQRIVGWHRAVQGEAWKVKLMAYLAGMEIQGLKSVLGVHEHIHTQKAAARLAAAFPDKGYSTWGDLIEGECDICERTGRNYGCVQESISRVISHELKARLRAISGCLLADNPKPLALPDRDAVVAAMSKSELQAFCEAVDPFNLHELYKRPVPPEKLIQRIEAAKAESERRELNQAEFFWFDTFEKQRSQKLHLRLERPHREVLLNSLQLMARELRESLRQK